MVKTYLSLFFLLFSCYNSDSNEKNSKKKISIVFDKSYNNDTLILKMDDTLVFKKILNTNPSIGIATNKIIHTLENKIKIGIILNGYSVFDSVIQVKNMSSCFFSYYKEDRKITMKYVDKIYLYD